MAGVTGKAWQAHDSLACCPAAANSCLEATRKLGFYSLLCKALGRRVGEWDRQLYGTRNRGQLHKKYDHRPETCGSDSGGPRKPAGCQSSPAQGTPRAHGNFKEMKSPGSKACPAAATHRGRAVPQNMPSLRVLARRRAKAEQLWRKENKQRGTASPYHAHNHWSVTPVVVPAEVLTSY